MSTTYEFTKKEDFVHFKYDYVTLDTVNQESPVIYAIMRKDMFFSGKDKNGNSTDLIWDGHIKMVDPPSFGGTSAKFLRVTLGGSNTDVYSLGIDSSARRYKEDILPHTDFDPDLSLVNVSSFKYKAQSYLPGMRKEFGFIAEDFGTLTNPEEPLEYKKIYQAKYVTSDGVSVLPIIGGDGYNEIQTVDDRAIIAILWAAATKLQEKVANLTARVTALEGGN